MMGPKIAIVDYGMANLRSVQKAFEHVGHSAVITGDPNQVVDADKVVLPGVGAFCDGMAKLNSSGLTGPILEHVRQGRPLLGICLGLQFLFTRGHEDGVHEGLNLFAGEVVRFGHVPGLKIPHMGWNQLKLHGNCPLFREVREGESVYFVHSYHAVPRDRELIAAETDYPTPFVSAIWRDNVYATQFHPEKSQRVGLTILKNFAEL
jgi:imidazole glycerol-phosphate synthase subunit HisH